MLFVNNRSGNGNINGNNNLHNNGRFVGIALTVKTIMKTYSNLYPELCSFENLFSAYKKARKHKTSKKYVQDFEKELSTNLFRLQKELLNKTYCPAPLIDFIIRDPKTRKISKSDFRDRIVHHALCNIIEPIFDKTFIYDSYANRKGKGTLKAIKRFEYFKRKVSKNNTRKCYVLKADIMHYFETLDHIILLQIISEKIVDKNVIKLIIQIMKNHKTKRKGAGMPLGNLTSQFFANVYLNELDQYVKHELKIKYYIRYVDDFVILSNSKEELEFYTERIRAFLCEKLKISLHPKKTKIFNMSDGVAFLGLRIFENHKLLKECNIRKFRNKLKRLCAQHDINEVDYDKIYDVIEGWIAHIDIANGHKLKIRMLEPTRLKFAEEMSTKEYNRHIKMMKDFGAKVEIQSLSSKGISFISEKYLPEKIRKEEWLD